LANDRFFNCRGPYRNFSIKTVSKKVDLSDIDKTDFKKRRKEMAEYMDEE